MDKISGHYISKEGKSLKIREKDKDSPETIDHEKQCIDDFPDFVCIFCVTDLVLKAKNISRCHKTPASADKPNNKSGNMIKKHRSLSEDSHKSAIKYYRNSFLNLGWHCGIAGTSGYCDAGIHMGTGWSPSCPISSPAPCLSSWERPEKMAQTFEVLHP